MNRVQDEKNRRDFFGWVVRGAAMGAIAAVSYVLLKRRFRPSPRCISRGFCRDCRAFGDCELPQAMTIKREPRISRIKTGDL